MHSGGEHELDAQSGARIEHSLTQEESSSSMAGLTVVVEVMVAHRCELEQKISETSWACGGTISTVVYYRLV
ncbi:hypothetical protein M0R45_035171 [Rubus argutus]|uniref:Uncharacterized protein n=1 Tax=Rubus argutus TaxID=59490 RepID=A0AAW1VTW1_RUBAR